MLDRVGYPEDRFSHVAAQIVNVLMFSTFTEYGKLGIF